MDWKHRSILQALVIGILCSCVRVVHAKDTLLSSQSMRDGDQFLISANQTFQFGFFSPEGSSLRYVGIWYHKLPGRTIVWVANRDRPVFDTTGVLTFDHYGNMFILDERGCSAVLTYGFGATNATAVTLLDTGNLVLRDTNNWSLHLVAELRLPYRHAPPRNEAWPDRKAKPDSHLMEVL
ncbi:hypothetical protein J5N97_011825 [Dioscorea zingiberensis]|uniref:Bulb-type lectin domain-containing protein n=1 Tax=Dioscorea zingiberensis TaxID=325984 RepID=A0A9D5D189_9LILI|nr:hypothetical protein J5N97_011825 [Dioscorea zingiberensis]